MNDDQLPTNDRPQAGYKQTASGLIPEDWNVKSIGDIADVKTGPFGSALHEKDYVIDGTPIITVEHLGELGVEHTNLPMASDGDKARLKAYLLKVGDLVFSRVGSTDRNALIKSSGAGWLFSGRLLRIRLNSLKDHSQYLSYHFHSTPFKQRVRDVAVGQTMPSLNTQIPKSIQIILPTEEEQRSLAQALSDVDALIASLDKTIAKKRNLKTATMQQLLTGKKRLPGFGEGKGDRQTEIGVISEDWRISVLGNLGKFKNGINKGSEDFGHGSPFVNLMDVFGISSISEVKHLGLVNSNDAEKKVYDLKNGDVLFVRSSVKPSGVGLTTIIIRNLPNSAYSGFLIRFRDDGNLETDFKKYCFSEEKFRKRVIASSTVSANTNINQDNLKQLSLAYPDSLEEQRAIATVLSDMDGAIAALEYRLAKTQSIKQGMMQELLTGRTRLI